MDSPDIGMKTEHRELLRRLKSQICKDLDAKKAVSEMTHLFSEEDEQWITHQSLTFPEKANRFMDTLLRKGPTAFQQFVKVCEKIHPHIAKKIIEESTLDDVVDGGLQRLEINDSDPLCDSSLRDLAQGIGSEFETLGTYLGISHVNIQKIKGDNPYNTENQIYNMLIKWRNTCPSSEDKVDRLASALKKSGRTDLAETLRDH
ncbi:death domain-containing protein CRADD-like [Ptychodera flava]|uniref:death domain-containing protein CRADD-like n=1 Tax=Ptychodera flava TaxID=63121 RepID=UPI003969C781